MFHINPEKLVKRYQDVPGSTLVGWREVAMAVYKLSVTAVLMQRSKLSPIDEFLLRSVGIGVSDAGTLCELLGLDTATVERHLIKLHREEFIALNSEHGIEKICLTKKGDDCAKAASSHKMREERLPVLFHGFARTVIPNRELRTTPECKRDEMLILGTAKGRPALDELTVADVRPVVRQLFQTRSNDTDLPELLGIKSISKLGPVMYEPGILLVYETCGDRQRHYSFVVEGEKRDDYAQRFDAKLLLPKQIEFTEFRSIGELASEFLTEARLPDHAGIVDTVIRSNEILEQIEEMTAREAAIVDDADDLADAPTPGPRTKELIKLRSDLAEANQRLAAARAVPLRTNDCDKLLTRAVDQCREKLVVISGTISFNAVEAFTRIAEKAVVNRNIEVSIGFGMGGKDRQSDEQRGRESFENAKVMLEAFQKKFPNNVRVKDLGDDHSKILICDSRFVAVGSYNWLSYKPAGKGRHRGEHAIQLSHSEDVEWFSRECDFLFGTKTSPPPIPQRQQPPQSKKIEHVDERSQQSVTGVNGPLANFVRNSKAPISQFEVFEGYQLIRRIIGGGMAEAWEALSPSGVTVFLKRVPVDSQFRAMIEREQEIYNKLYRIESKYIVSFVDWISTASHLAIVTEFTTDGDLKSCVGESGLRPEHVHDVAMQIAHALQVLHSNNIVHRDLKADNVLRFGESWKLTDFGISKNLLRLGQQTVRGRGTPGYAPPEQSSFAEAHPSADIYAYGKLLTFLLTGTTDIDRVPPGDWQRVVHACTERKVDERLDIDLLLNALKQIAMDPRGDLNR